MNPKEYADYLTQLIPDTVEVLVGHSFGGKIAVHMSFIKKYKNLVLIGAPLMRKNPKKNQNFTKTLEFPEKSVFLFTHIGGWINPDIKRIIDNLRFDIMKNVLFI